MTASRNGIFAAISSILRSRKTRIGNAWTVRGSILRFEHEHLSTHAVAFTEHGTQVTIAAGARIGLGTRIHLLGGTLDIATAATLGESVDLRPTKAIVIRSGAVVEDGVQLQCDASELTLGERVRIGRFTRIWAHSAPITLGDETTIGPSCTFIGTGRGITIAPCCDFTHAVTVDSSGGSIEMATRSGVGPNSVLYGHGGLRIGSGVAIAGLTMLVPGNHRFAQLDVPIRAQGTEPLPIAIGDDVWIGAGVTVLGGASISDGCVIAAGSVVRGHIPPRVVAAGVPARIIRSRDATNQSVIPPATQS